MSLQSHTAQIINKGIGHSVGLKLLLVCFLVLLMGIPALFIAAISYERAGRSDDVTREVSQRYGGAQTLLGPVLSVPYGIRDTNGDIRSSGDYVIFAEDGMASVENLQTIVRKRSLFKVPTYQANVKFTAKFKLPDRENLATVRHVFYWEDAKISIGLTEVRGLRDDVYLAVSGGKTRKFGPGGNALGTIQSANALSGTRMFKSYDEYIPLQFMDVRVGDLVAGSDELNISASLPISGSQQLSISPFAQTTKASITADWPHPGFLGSFPPTEREISADGFSASWVVPFLARGMAATGEARDLNLGQLTDKAMSVKFVNPVNPYQNVNRALKYAILFIGMVFLAYFLFETLVGVKVHAAQYVLVGLAQSVFYLLLLAFAEHIGFTFAFMLAAGATVFITSAYAGVVFGKSYTLKAGAVFAATYGLLYVLMRIEDFALMVGALASFLAIAATMYLTRNVNWYGGGQDSLTQDAT
ncbi:MAG: cell envelope integrity protein CreD [Robiginitomaculum sp.]|nr:cell envelope integrity protein CreD [Robiginitomaculum sp.]